MSKQILPGTEVDGDPVVRIQDRAPGGPDLDLGLACPQLSETMPIGSGHRSSQARWAAWYLASASVSQDHAASGSSGSVTISWSTSALT